MIFPLPSESLGKILNLMERFFPLRFFSENLHSMAIFVAYNELFLQRFSLERWVWSAYFSLKQIFSKHRLFQILILSVSQILVMLWIFSPGRSQYNRVHTSIYLMSREREWRSTSRVSMDKSRQSERYSSQQHEDIIFWCNDLLGQERRCLQKPLRGYSHLWIRKNKLNSRRSILLQGSFPKICPLWPNDPFVLFTIRRVRRLLSGEDATRNLGKYLLRISESSFLMNFSNLISIS